MLSDRRVLLDLKCVLTFEFLQSLIHTAQIVKELQGFICICFGNGGPGKQVFLDLKAQGKGKLGNIGLILFAKNV